MGFSIWMLWQNPPATSAVDPILDTLHKEYFASSTAGPRCQIALSSYRSSFPSSRSPTPSTYPRLLYTHVSPSSPFVFALVDDPEGASPHLMAALTPPPSLNVLLSGLKSGFVAPSAVAASRTNQIDMGTSSAKTVKPTISSLRIDGFTVEVPLSRPGGRESVGQLSPDPTGKGIEFLIRGGPVVGAGGVAKGVVIEAEYVPEMMPEGATTPEAYLRAMLETLVPSVPSPRLTFSSTATASWPNVSVQGGADEAGGWSDEVERGRRSAYLLVDTLRTAGLM